MKTIINKIHENISNSEFADKVYIVGGYVRDELMGLNSKDLDLVIEMKGGSRKFALWLQQLFTNTTAPFQLGEYPIYAIKINGETIEIAETMSETFPDENSRQREVQFGTLEDDIRRRDFTINMMMRDLTTMELIDGSGVGLEDLETQTLRCHPEVPLSKIISDDPLRMMRMVRFCVKYDFHINFTSRQCISHHVHRIKVISAERVRDELFKMAELGKLEQGLRVMDEVNLLGVIFPELIEAKEIFHDQNTDYHKEGDGELLEHLLLVTKHCPEGVLMQFAGLLHDIGKLTTRTVSEDGRVRFLGHEDTGVPIAEDIMRRLKFPLDLIKPILRLVNKHMAEHALWRSGKPSQKAVRKFVRKMGDDLESVLLLSRADILGNYPVRDIPDTMGLIKDVPMVQSDKPLLNGHDLMSLGFDGPEIKIAQGKIRERQDELPTLTKEQAEHYIMFEV